MLNDDLAAAPDIVGTDATDTTAYQVEFLHAHRQGVPHRVVHIEVRSRQGFYLVWARRDRRLEIPGGHLDWLSGKGRPETYEEGALREISEELDLPANWRMEFAAVAERLREGIVPLAKASLHNRTETEVNNEWAVVYRLNWNNDWGDPTTFVLGDESNSGARWWPTTRLMKEAGLRGAEGINTSIRLFLGRRGFLVPETEH